MEALLEQVYEEKGHPGQRELYVQANKEAKMQGQKPITHEQIKNWLKRQSKGQLFAPNTLDRRSNYFKITADPNTYAVDSIMKDDGLKSKNSGYIGFLLFVELTTRKSYAYPFKTGPPPTMTEALEIFKRFDSDRKQDGHPVAHINSDNGKEFDNTAVRRFLKDNLVGQYFLRPEDHRANSILDNVAKYVRQKLLHHTNWVKVIDHTLKIWNDHTIFQLKGSPDVFWDDKEKRQEIRANALKHNKEVWERNKVKEDDAVKRYMRRNTTDKGLFDKGGQNWTTENYKVGERQGYSFLLKDVEGRALKNAYRPYELKHIPKEEFVAEQNQKDTERMEREELKKAARNQRRVKKELGKEAPTKIVRERRQVKAPQVLNMKPQPTKARQKKVGIQPKKGKLVRVVEKVIQYRYWRKKLEFKVKWAHLSEAESLALPWEPVDNFTAIDEEGDLAYNPVIAKYMDAHDLD